MKQKKGGLKEERYGFAVHRPVHKLLYVMKYRQRPLSRTLAASRARLGAYYGGVPSSTIVRTNNQWRSVYMA